MPPDQLLETVGDLCADNTRGALNSRIVGDALAPPLDLLISFTAGSGAEDVADGGAENEAIHELAFRRSNAT